MSEFNLRHEEMTPSEKRAITAAANKEKRDARERWRRELLELMIMSLQMVLDDETISGESRLKATILMNDLRMELRL